MSDKTCGVFVMTKQGKFLLLTKRKNNEYDIPKGKMEGKHKNDELECAFDELRQETGILRHHINLEANFRYEHNNAEKVIFLGWIEKEVKIKRSKEHKKDRWEKWNPPHKIQSGWLDSLLENLEEYFHNHPESKKIIF